MNDGILTKDVLFLDNKYFLSVVEDQLIIQGLEENEEYAQIFVL